MKHCMESPVDENCEAFEIYESIVAIGYSQSIQTSGITVGTSVFALDREREIL